MFNFLRRNITEESKEKIFKSKLYRLYSRYQLERKIVRFSVEVTTKCNCNCVMCTRANLVKQKKLNAGDIDEKFWIKILEEMKKFVKNGWQVYYCPMGLGEPLFYSKLLSSIEDVKKISLKIKVVIATNGITLSKTVSKKLIQAGVDEISISLNSENEKKYFLNMGVKAFSVVKKNIKDLIEIRNKIEGSKSLIFVQYLDFERNRNKFLKEIHCWKKIMRINDKCYIHSIVNQGGMVDTIDKDKRINYPCAQPNFRVAIKIDGSLYPCDVCFYSGNKKIDSLYLGNILKNGIYNDFMDKNSKRWKIIKLMRDYNYKKLPICEKCTTSKLSSNSYFKIPKFLKFKKVWL